MKVREDEEDGKGFSAVACAVPVRRGVSYLPVWVGIQNGRVRTQEQRAARSCRWYAERRQWYAVRRKKVECRYGRRTYHPRNGGTSQQRRVREGIVMRRGIAGSLREMVESCSCALGKIMFLVLQVKSGHYAPCGVELLCSRWSQALMLM